MEINNEFKRKMIKRVAGKKGVELSEIDIDDIYADIKNTENIDINDEYTLISAKIDDIKEARGFTNPSNNYKYFMGDQKDPTEGKVCPRCKTQMAHASLANDQKTWYCNKCKVVLPIKNK